MLRVTDVLRSVAERDWFTSVELTDAYFHVPIAMHHRKFLCFSFKNKLSVQSSIIWPLTSPSCVYEMYEGCPVSPVGPRSANSTISGRLAALSSDEGPICAQYTATTRPFGQVGSLSEQGKELSVPCTIHHVHRDDYRFNLNACLSVSDDRYSKPSCPVSSGSVSTVWSVPEASRDANSSLLHNSPGITPSATPASMEQPSAVGLISSSASAGYSDSQLRACPPQVGFPNLFDSRCAVRNCSLWPQSCNNRCNPHGLGGGMEPQRYQWQMVEGPIDGPHQLVGDACSFSSLEPFYLPPTCLFDQTIRQPFSIWIIRGGTKSESLLQLTRKILTWSLPRFASLRAAYLPGVVNQVADALSRNWIHPGKWRLHPDVVQGIWWEFGTAEVDLFASENTTHCPLWFAQVEASSLLGQDALSHDWPDCLLYAFPPIPLLWETLHRITQGRHRVLLIAPRWLAKPWFPLLLTLLVGKPRQLPVRRDLLSQLDGRIWHPDPARLQLWVWPLGPTPY